MLPIHRSCSLLCFRESTVQGRFPKVKKQGRTQHFWVIRGRLPIFVIMKDMMKYLGRFVSCNPSFILRANAAPLHLSISPPPPDQQFKNGGQTEKNANWQLTVPQCSVTFGLVLAYKSSCGFSMGGCSPITLVHPHHPSQFPPPQFKMGDKQREKKSKAELYGG